MATPRVDPAKVTICRNYIDSIARAQDPTVLDALRRHAAAVPPDHVTLSIGYSSVVALPFHIAALRTGTIKNWVGVSLDRNASPGAHMGAALADYARESGVPFTPLAPVNAVLAGRESEIPAEIMSAVEAMRQGAGRVSLIESIAFATLLMPPGQDPLSVVNLKKNGRLVRMSVGVATDTQRDMTMNVMGDNPDVWRTLLKGANLLGPESIGASFSAWMDFGAYGLTALAKRRLEARNVEWNDAHADSLGRHRVVMQPATITPALDKIPGGLLLGIESILQRRALGDTLDFANIGALALLGIVDPVFVHTQLAREMNGSVVGFVDKERQAWPAIAKKFEDLERAVPADLTDEMEGAESARILAETFDWPDDWRSYLAPITMMESVMEAPPAA